MKTKIPYWHLGIFLFSGIVIPFSQAQDITLSYGTPAEVNMNSEILDAGVSLFRRAVEEDVIRNVVLLVARNGKIILHEAIGWTVLKDGSYAHSGSDGTAAIVNPDLQLIVLIFTQSP